MSRSVLVAARLSINRESPVPYYFQLAELIEHEITGRRLAPGARLPSEFELCGRFGVSRTTVRQALASLGTQGPIRRKATEPSWPHGHDRRAVECRFLPRRGERPGHRSRGGGACDAITLPTWGVWHRARRNSKWSHAGASFSPSTGSSPPRREPRARALAEAPPSTGGRVAVRTDRVI
jgi:DNA-binding transcriptional MocR family regulator